MELYNDVFNQLQDYILNEKNMQKSLEFKIQYKGRDKNNVKVKYDRNNAIATSQLHNKKSDIFIPNQQDTLFWCFYIIKFGDVKYETSSKNSLIAKQLKIDLVTEIRKKKDIIKMYKFDSIINTESNLANDDTLNIKTFFTLCAIENVNAVFVRKNTYFELLMNDSDVVYIIREIAASLTNVYHIKYGLEMGTKESVTNIRETLYKIDKVGKPIKAISAYTIADLITICNKLAIEIIYKETGKNKSKNDLYESIIQYF